MTASDDEENDIFGAHQLDFVPPAPIKPAGVAEVERALKSSATPGTIDYVRGSANLMLNTSLLTGAR